MTARAKAAPLLLTTVCFLAICRMGFADSTDIRIGTKTLWTLDTSIYPDSAKITIYNLSHSSILIGFYEKVYGNFNGHLILGFRVADAESAFGNVFLHHLFAHVADSSNSLRVGLTRLRSRLIAFPALREDDALLCTDVISPFSLSARSEDSQYGAILEYAHTFGKNYPLAVFAEHYAESSLAAPESDFRLNAYGASFEYRVPENREWTGHILSQLGVGFSSFITDRPGYSSLGDRALGVASLSGIVNLYTEPIHLLELRSQGIYCMGFDETEEIVEYAEIAKAKSLTAFTLIRYLYHRNERPALQLSLGLGYKAFPGLSYPTNQLDVIANLFYRFNKNFDWGFQYTHSRRNGHLRELFGGDESGIQLATIFSIVRPSEDQGDDEFDYHESLLNVEHRHIP